MSDFPELSQLTELITQGRFSEAKQIAEKLPDIVQKENAFGMIYYYEGKLDDAIEHFKKAVEIDPINSDVLFNYGKALFDKKDYKEAWRYLLRIHNKDWAVYDLLGDTQIVQGNIPMALYYYRKAAEISPLEEMKKKYLEYKKHYHQDVNIAILCLPGLDNFIRDIADILGEVYNVRLVVSANGNEIVQAYEWADIVWLERANELAVEVTNKLEKKGKKIICRLHSYEALTNAFLYKIVWDKVDTIVMVAEHMKDVLRMYHPDVYKRLEDKIKVIHNGLNLERFRYKPRTRGYNIAVVAHINYKKDPTMWLQIMGLLKKIDPRYNLSIAGDFQDYRYHLYFHYFIEEAGLRDNVKLLGHVNNIEEFLEDKNYVLSTSVHESFGYKIAEAMAVGIKPVVHNFYGAKMLWMEDTLFNFIEEIPQILESDYRSETYRKFVEDTYPLELQMEQITKVLEIQRAKTATGKGDRLVVPSKSGISVEIRNYEEELERKLPLYGVPITYVDTKDLISNIEDIMVDFLVDVFDKKLPAQKTVYYQFLSDMHQRGLYLQPPELIISRFLKLFESIKTEGKILKPVVAFINDGNLVVYDPVNMVRLKLSESKKFLVASGRHRVAISEYLGLRKVPSYIILNSFGETDKPYQILVPYWRNYVESVMETYYKKIAQIYVGAFDYTYQDTLDPTKKKLVYEFITKVKANKVIDIGCNRGELSYNLTRLGIEVLGVDISPREKLGLPDDYRFLQLDIAQQELEETADVILFLSLYHHLFYNYGLEKADAVFFNLYSKCRYLVFDSGHPEEKGIFRQAWINKMREFFKTERELLDHFQLPYSVLGRWRTSQGSYRTIVVFENQELSNG